MSAATVSFIAWTPKEGVWYFTESNTHYEAIQKFVNAISLHKILVHPMNNPVSTVKAHGVNYGIDRSLAAAKGVV